jgi:hypothetical protein
MKKKMIKEDKNVSRVFLAYPEMETISDEKVLIGGCYFQALKGMNTDDEKGLNKAVPIVYAST